MEQLSGLSQQALDDLQSAQSQGEGIRLPFPALFCYVINGDSRLRNVTPAQYYGGFATDLNFAGEMVDSGDIPSLPRGWEAYTSGDGDKEYSNLSTRTIDFAFIKERASWLNKDGTSRIAKYDETHRRRHIQYLGLIFVDGKYFSPGILSAKGYQVGYLTDSVSAWDKALNPLRKQLNATRLPRSAFWYTVGTFGDKPYFVEVGSDVKNKITPVKAVVPSGLSAKDVEMRFIGADNINIAAELLAQANEWLNAWKDEQPVQISEQVQQEQF